MLEVTQVGNGLGGNYRLVDIPVYVVLQVYAWDVLSMAIGYAVMYNQAT